MTTLHAFREDGTEVLPGETITMAGNETDLTFRAATEVSDDAGTSGMIAVDGYPDMFSAPFGLTVRAVSDQSEHPAEDAPGIPLLPHVTPPPPVHDAGPKPEPPRAGERRAWADSEIPDDALDRA